MLAQEEPLIGGVGLVWISALKTSDIRPLLKRPRGAASACWCASTPTCGLSGRAGARRCMGVSHCFPRLWALRARRREALLRATENILEGIAAKLRRKNQSLRGRNDDRPCGRP